jgi:hypothetical protein
MAATFTVGAPAAARAACASVTRRAMTSGLRAAAPRRAGAASAYRLYTAAELSGDAPSTSEPAAAPLRAASPATPPPPTAAAAAASAFTAAPAAAPAAAAAAPAANGGFLGAAQELMNGCAHAHSRSHASFAHTRPPRNVCGSRRPICAQRYCPQPPLLS